MKTIYRYKGRSGDFMYWEASMPGDSRVEQVKCQWDWFWSQQKDPQLWGGGVTSEKACPRCGDAPYSYVTHCCPDCTCDVEEFDVFVGEPHIPPMPERVTNPECTVHGRGSRGRAGPRSLDRLSEEEAVEDDGEWEGQA